MTRVDVALMSAMKYLRPRTEYIEDHLLSSIHYKLSFGVILACAILTGLTSWYSPIECLKPAGNEFDLPYVKQWCYANSTFIVEGPAAEDGIYHGIINSNWDNHHRIVYISYYQWISLSLFIQAAFFQIPRLLWKTIKGGRVRKLVERLRELEMASYPDRTAGIAQLAHRFGARRHVDSVRYVKGFIVCQCLYLANAIAQIAFTHYFLRGHFISLMPRWLAGRPILNTLFPKAVKCTLMSYGSGGSPSKHDVLCVLAMNVLNEKVYLLLWTLLVLTLATAIAQVVYIAAAMTSWRLRNAVLRISDDTEHADGPKHFNSDPNLSKGEWLIMKFVKDNLDDSLLFDDFINRLAGDRLGLGEGVGEAVEA